MAELKIRGRSGDTKEVVVWKRRETCRFSECEAAALGRVGVNVVMPVLADMRRNCSGGAICKLDSKPICKRTTAQSILYVSMFGKEIARRGAFVVARAGDRKAVGLIELRRHPVVRMHTNDFHVGEAELAIKSLAREIPGEESIHSSLFPWKD